MTAYNCEGMRYVKVLFAGILILSAQMLSAQTDKSEVRKGNREYRKGEFKEAEIDYRRALVKDSLSFAANYNLACDLYRQEQYDEAGNYMKKIADQAAEYLAGYIHAATARLFPEEPYEVVLSGGLFKAEALVAAVSERIDATVHHLNVSPVQGGINILRAQLMQ